MAEADHADLAAFAAVARVRSFRQAALRRGVSPSALSEAVRRLEARLGLRLLHRTTRSVTPTEAGARLLERLVPALAELDAALDAVNHFRDSPAGTLRLNVPVIVARLVLPRIIEGFLAAHPAIVLEVEAQDAFVDIIGAGFDAGIRYDERLARDMIAQPIGPRSQRYATAAAPAYLARHGMPAHPRDLLGHAAIRHRFSGSGASPSWEFARDGEILHVDAPARLTASIAEVEVSAAIAGLGVIATFEEVLAPCFAAGTLVPILAEWWPRFSGPRLYYPSRQHMPAPLRAFVDYVRDKGRW